MEENNSLGESVVVAIPVVLTTFCYLSIFTGKFAGVFLIPILAGISIFISAALLLLHLLSNIKTSPSSKIFSHPIVFSCLFGIVGSGGLFMWVRGLFTWFR